MTTGVAIAPSKLELYSIVADLEAHGYRAADIARALDRSSERIRQILRDLGVNRPRIRSTDDLPPHLRERVVAFRNLKNAS
jgi:hypothetical protein